MRLLKQIRHILLFFTLFLGKELKAQDLYSFPNSYQWAINTGSDNPALLAHMRISEKMIQPLSEFETEIILPFSFLTLFSQNSTTRSYDLDFSQISDKAFPNNNFYLNAALQWFSVVGKHSGVKWNFKIQDRILLGAGIEDRFIDLINLGNKAFLGETVVLNFPFNAMHFRSYQFSWAKTLNKQFDFGITGKLYFGKSWIDLDADISLYTHPSADYLRITAVGKGRASFPLTLEDILNNIISTSDFSSYLFGVTNPGLGIDVGMIYQMTPQIQLSASINDLGFIFWNSNTTTFTANDTYTWTGIDLSGKFDFQQLGSLSENSTIISLRDTFLNRLIEPEDRHFLTMAPTTFNSAVVYKYDRNMWLAVRLRALFHSHFIRDFFTASGGYTLTRKWQLVSGITYSTPLLLSFPTGFNYQGRRLHIGLMLSNLLEVFVPARSKVFGGSLTISYRLAEERHDDSEYYPFYTKRNKHNLKLLIFQNSK